MITLWAVLPAKGFTRAKSRLGEVLSDPVRAAFARGLFEHVLGTLKRAAPVRGVLVLTDDSEVEALALSRGAHVLRDQAGSSLAQIIDAGLSHVESLGAQGALVCMADLPHLREQDIEQAAAALAQATVVIAPDSGEAGTNLLALRQAKAFGSCFGHADSFARHMARAKELGQSSSVLRTPGLCFDVDGPQDLEDL